MSVESLIKAVEVKRFLKNPKCVNNQSILSIHRTTQQGTMLVLGLERKLNAIEFCGAKGSQ